jgi:mono/diheme cytochrome c family protein
MITSSVLLLLWSQPPAIDFARDVRPILERNCVDCHGPTVEEGGLRLDIRERFLAGGVSGPAVVPKNAGESRLYQLVASSNPDERMPRFQPPLAAEEMEILKRWIDEGARWSEGASLPLPPSPSTPGRWRFNRDVRPILAECFSCHGPDRNQRKAGLRLDREEAAKSVLPSGNVAIVPGDPEKSALISRVAHADESRRMPLGKPRLPDARIETLRQWIEDGAAWEPHWSYAPPLRAPGATIDAFVDAAIAREGLTARPEAGKSELLRRLKLDLTGLPPSAGEIREFENDTSPDAYERRVEGYLASPQYGERMASYWLDLVRYSDSVGYHSDNARPMWRYRDWVVSAFNENVPFDRFTIEQIAGDLLDQPTFDQRIASGYNRLLQTTEEGGAQEKEYRAIYLADRARNVSTVWLGATLGCAQCHDHKFDPYLQKDFYAFEAFFADVVEPPVGRRKPDALPFEVDRPLFEALERDVERIESELKAKTPGDDWEETVRRTPVCWTTLEPVSVSSENGTRVLIQGNDFSLIATTRNGPKPPADTYTVRFTTALRGARAFRLEAVPFEELPKGGPGRALDGGFVVTGIELHDGAGRPVDFLAPRTPWEVRAANGETHRLILETAAPAGEGEETTYTLVIRQDAGGGRTLGRFRFSATASTDSVCRVPGPGVSRDLKAIALTPAAERTPLQQRDLLSFYRETAPELAPLRGLLREASLRRDEVLDRIPQSYVTTTEAPEPVRVLPRGNWLDDSGEVVSPAVPHFLPPLDTKGRRPTRLDLARWLVSRENPLPARVFVNRLWKLFFGQGLSRTLEDLGTQGEWPTHPELLDWLAIELTSSGWDVKHVVRTIVTSSAYRRSAVPSKELLDRDPYNRLYARQSRIRLDAEMVRDSALATAGLLSLAMGGPSVYPHQPEGYWSFLNFPPREWEDSTGEDQNRRGLYTWWQRSFLHPSLLAFDAPTREECVAERTRSNVPQQALALLNDPTYVEAARAFAARIEGSGDSFEERIDWAYRRALSRAPSGEEVAILRGLYRKHQDWFSVARAILNLPELITRP